MDHLPFPLNAAIDADHAGIEHDTSVFFEGFQPEDEVGNTGLIFDGDEHGSVAKIALMSERAPEFSARLLMSDFKWRHFQGEVILWAVRWYCRYGVSYRDLEQMMAERGVPVDHSTIYR